MNLTRREILHFVGGSAVGLILSPFPWKALNDTANWSQNWPGVPEPTRGPVSYKLTTCSLCPAACGMKVRCVGNRPVSISGLNSHPLNQGALCPTGIVSHHLQYHPARNFHPLRIVKRNGVAQKTKMTMDETLHEIGKAIKAAAANSKIVALIDERSGRTISQLYRQFAASIPFGMYIKSEESMVGYDIDNAKTILSFGAPLLDGWGSPSRALRYFNRKAVSQQQIIQIESCLSRTAGKADKWIPIKPSTEIAFALGLVNIITHSTNAKTNNKIIAEIIHIATQFTPEKVSTICGIKEDLIKDVAYRFVSTTPSIAVTDHRSVSKDVQTVIQALNIINGNIGSIGGVTQKRAFSNEIKENASGSSEVLDIQLIPDNSIHVMIVDESLSGSRISDALLQKKIVQDKGIVVSLSPFVHDRSFDTQYYISTPVFLETVSDVEGAIDNPVSILGISTQIMPTPQGLTEPAQFIQNLARLTGVTNVDSGTSEELIKKRAEIIFRQKRGTIYSSVSGQATEVKAIVSFDDLWKELVAGGCWMDKREILKNHSMSDFIKPLSKIDINSWNSLKDNVLYLIPMMGSGQYSSERISPIMSKVDQESGLRPYGRQVFLHPSTGKKYECFEGEEVIARTQKGSMKVQVRLDSSIMPQVAMVAMNSSGQENCADLFDKNFDLSIRPTPMNIEKV